MISPNCTEGLNMTTPSLSFFCDNFFSKNAIKFKFPDFNFMPFRHILTKFHVMYPWGSKSLAIFFGGGKKKEIYQIHNFFCFYLYVHLLIAILCLDTKYLLDTVK